MPVQRLARRARNFIVDGVLGVHDTPHRIALGVAVALFVTWTPTIGFQMALTLFLATVLRANKVVGIPFAWLTNPATLWIYIPNYILGCWLLGEPAEVSRLTAALAKVFALEGSVSERFTGLRDVLQGFLAPLWLGSVIVGLLLGGLGYVAVYRGVVAYRRRHAHAQPPQASAPIEQLEPLELGTAEPQADRQSTLDPARSAQAARRAEASRLL